MDGKRNEGVNSYKHPDGSLNRCVCPQQLRNMQLQGGSVCIGDVGPFLIGGDIDDLNPALEIGRGIGYDDL